MDDLCHAVHYGLYDRVLEFLFNETDYNIKSAVYIASDHGFDDILQLLLINDGNPNFQLSNGSSPLSVASSKGFLSTVKILMSYTKYIFYKNAFYGAVIFNHTNIVKFFIDKGISFSESNINPSLKFSLEISCENNNMDIVHYLLKHSSFGVINERYYKNIVYSVLNNKDMLELFLLNGLDPNTKFPMNPHLISLGRSGYYSYMPPETRTAIEANCTLLFLATYNDRIDIVKILLKYKADPNIYVDGYYYSKKYNYTPLHVAIYRNNLNIVELLLQYGTDLSLETIPYISCASYYKRDTISKYLTSYLRS
jgi:ankyrin repeat protein